MTKTAIKSNLKFPATVEGIQSPQCVTELSSFPSRAECVAFDQFFTINTRDDKTSALNLYVFRR